MNVPWRLLGFPLASPPPHTHLHPGFLHQSLPKTKTNNVLISVVLLHGPLKAKEHLSQRSLPSELQVPSGQIMHGLPVTSAACVYFTIDFGNEKFDVYLQTEDMQLQPQVREKQGNNPKTLHLGCATGFPYPAGQALPKGERSSTATSQERSGCGLWLNEKHGDLQSYMCCYILYICMLVTKLPFQSECDTTVRILTQLNGPGGAIYA